MIKKWYFKIFHERQVKYLTIALSVIVSGLFSVKSFGSFNDGNIVISKSVDAYKFVWVKSADEVQVQQTMQTLYSCSLFGATVNSAENYNNITSIDKIEMTVDGKRRKDLKPDFIYNNDDEIFYSDDRLCLFALPLEKKGSTGAISFTKITSDPRFFNYIFFSERYSVLYKEVIIEVPRWMNVELREMNFNSLSINKTSRYDKKNDADIFTYTILNLPAFEKEENSPGASHIFPHLLVLTKEAVIGNTVKTYFKTVKDQYQWCKKMAQETDGNSTLIKAKAHEIAAGVAGDIDKIKAVFYWVQNNIRYLAFEEGAAGFRPDKADEVLRKKYGDCKGMTNITKQLLKSLGYDARLCWIGTNDIAYNYLTPSLANDDHIICALKLKGQFYFLDATETFLGFNEYAERIQARQCMIEDGENFILTNIPSTNYNQNSDKETVLLFIDSNNLKGTAVRDWQGEAKEYILTNLKGVKKNNSNLLFSNYLSKNNNNCIISDLTTTDVSNYDQTFTASYSIRHKNAIASAGKKYYVDLNFEKEFSDLIIDTVKRNFDYWFHYKKNISSVAELTLPAGYTVSFLPPPVEIKKDNYEFFLNYRVSDNKIVYTKKLIIKDIKLFKQQFTNWNKDIMKLNSFYNNQIVLSAK